MIKTFNKQHSSLKGFNHKRKTFDKWKYYYVCATHISKRQSHKTIKQSILNSGSCTYHTMSVYKFMNLCITYNGMALWLNTTNIKLIHTCALNPYFTDTYKKEGCVEMQALTILKAFFNRKQLLCTNIQQMNLLTNCQVLANHLHALTRAHTHHRYTTLNKDRKQHHAPCILPVQLTSLVGNEAGFAQNHFERNENWSNPF